MKGICGCIDCKQAQLAVAQAENEEGRQKALDAMELEAIGLVIGAASMCWSEVPKGVFDSTRAMELQEKLIAELRHIERLRG